MVVQLLGRLGARASLTPVRGAALRQAQRDAEFQHRPLNGVSLSLSKAGAGDVALRRAQRDALLAFAHRFASSPARAPALQEELERVVTRWGSA